MIVFLECKGAYGAEQYSGEFEREISHLSDAFIDLFELQDDDK
jgi:hypothetical protein